MMRVNFLYRLKLYSGIFEQRHRERSEATSCSFVLKIAVIASVAKRPLAA